MSITVRLPGPLRELAQGRATVDIDADVADVRQAFTELRRQFPAVYDRIMTEQGELRPHVNVFVGTENVRFGDGLGTRLDAASEIIVLPAVSGGVRSG